MRHFIWRGEEEGVVIDDSVTVTVLEIDPEWVRLGINSPDSVPPYQEEIVYFAAAAQPAPAGTA